MSVHLKAICGILILLILLPSLFFPISPDQAIFFLGAKKMLQGGRLYIDFIDIKPPLIFYIFAVIQRVLGEGELAMRGFDLLWQSATVLSLVFCVKRWVDDEKIAWLSGLVYALTFTALKYTSTLQAETFAGLFIVWLLYLKHPAYAGKYTNIAIGTLLALLLLLKYTFVFAALGLICFDLFFSPVSRRRLIPAYGVQFGAFLVVIALLLLPAINLFALDHSTMEMYRRFSLYLSGYVSLQPANGELVKMSYREVAHFFADQYSLFFTLLIGGVVYREAVKRSRSLDQHQQFYFLLFVVSGFLLLSIILERRFIPYHFARLQPMLAPMVATGIALVYSTLLERWKAYVPAVKSFLIALCLLAVFYSPLLKFIQAVSPSYLYIRSQEAYNTFFDSDDPGESVLIRKQQKQAVQYLLEHKKPQDRVYVISVCSDMLYFFLHQNFVSAFPSTQFYLGTWVPEVWREQAFRELQTVEWVIVQKNDVHPMLIGSSSTSVQAIREHSQFYDYIIHNFIQVQDFRNFIIYQRRVE